MNVEHAERKRDLRLRRVILQLLHAARTRPDNGWADGRFIFDMVESVMPRGRGLLDDSHCVGLIRDLCDCALVEPRDDRRRAYEPAGLDRSSYRITAKGTALIEQQIEPVPLVDDDRIRKS